MSVRLVPACARAGVLILVLAPANLSALDPAAPLSQYTVTNWNTAQGLPHPKVQAITQDLPGFLWVGTEGGVARFDGVRFAPLAPPEAPDFATVSARALLVTPDGSLWIGRDDGVVGRWKDGRIRVFRGPKGREPSLIRGLALDEAGTLWVGAYEGLFRLAGDQLVPVPVDTGMVYSLTLDRHGRLWVPTDRGVFVFEHGRVVQHLGKRDGLPSSLLYAAGQTADGAMWLGTARGLVVERDGRWSPPVAGMPDRFVRVVLPDRRGQVWAGTWSGLARISAGAVSVLRAGQGLVDDSINALFEDRDGSLWVGTRGAGLHLLRDAAACTHATAQGLRHNNVDAVLADRSGRIWTRPPDGPPDIFANGRWSALRADGFRPAWIDGMAEDRDGSVWLVSDVGLGRVGPAGYRLELPASRLKVDSLAPARAGGLWLLSAHRLFRFGAPGLETLPFASADAGEPRTVFRERADGSLLMSTTGGLAVYRPDGSVSLVWRSQTADIPVVSAVDDGPDRVFFAVEGTALGLLAGGTVRLFDKRDGLPDNWISQLVLDADRRLWMGTHSGIAVVPVAALTAAAATPAPLPAPLPVRVLTGRDGLRSTYVESYGEPEVAAAPDATLWFPSPLGVVAVDPRKVSAAEEPLVAVVDTITIDGRTWERGDAHAAPGRGDMDVAFTTPSPGLADEPRFRYRLDGYDRDWQHTTRRSARYTNLPPGTYRFRVQVAARDGRFAGGEAGVAIVLAPRFYQTRAFMWLTGLGLVGLAAGAHGVNTRRLRARAIHLQRSADDALARVRVLTGLLPICASCKRIRDGSATWHPIESYLRNHSEASFSHGICPDCMAKLYPEYIDQSGPT